MKTIMKTAIQQVMDEIEMYHNNGVEISKRVLLKMLLKAKEKERQQIIEAGNVCARKQHLYELKICKMTNDELFRFAESNLLTVGEEYYNKKFN